MSFQSFKLNGEAILEMPTELFMKIDLRENSENNNETFLIPQYKA